MIYCFSELSVPLFLSTECFLVLFCSLCFCKVLFIMLGFVEPDQKVSEHHSYSLSTGYGDSLKMTVPKCHVWRGFSKLPSALFLTPRAGLKKVRGPLVEASWVLPWGILIHFHTPCMSSCALSNLRDCFSKPFWLTRPMDFHCAWPPPAGTSLELTSGPWKADTWPTQEV